MDQDLRCNLYCTIVYNFQVFWDLITQYEEGSNGVLHIVDNELLGKGGFGFVCKGELKLEVNVKPHYCDIPYIF